MLDALITQRSGRKVGMCTHLTSFSSYPIAGHWCVTPAYRLGLAVLLLLVQNFTSKIEMRTSRSTVALVVGKA